ncbi:MAG: SDR family NAD(P)-dependent oxidoreductase [Thermoleophilaceae bacterium]|jgi:short-subunit dehydrogenase|nr:SDR family NAD(P)-dependent oxidoreductase [Thermoleophilaceae bacterium]
MELDGARFLVAGATGEFGAALARELSEQGCELAVLGRDRERLEGLAGELSATSGRFDARDRAGIEGAVDALAAGLGGLDGVVVAVGAAAFGAGGDLSLETVEDVFAINTLAPIALVSAALPHLPDDGAIVGVTAIVADHPTAGLAAYSASKAAFSAYLAVLRRERRRAGGTVLDVRPPHMDTAFAEHALTGEPPPLPEPVDHLEVVARTIAALREGRRELAWDLESRALVTR